MELIKTYDEGDATLSDDDFPGVNPTPDVDTSAMVAVYQAEKRKVACG